eukprot:GFUD01094257.1.p1 GENE.GFUD01094257.1~~GFUD01094257.1.p1  ORF type:complete len:1559 (+),score=423.64 GFUD01094257.1:143-4819(+)
MAPRNEDMDMGESGGSPPDAPMLLEISDWDATLVRLKWKAPGNDGGAPITYYVIEFKTRADEEWQQAPKVKAEKMPKGVVEGLTTGSKYEFRVLAENRCGSGPASDVTNPLLVKSQKAPPKICRKTMVEKILRVNQQLDLSVPVEGEPAPECSWLLNGSELKSSDNVKVSTANNVAKLLLIPARRANVGKYTLNAKNKWGEDSVEIEVNIFGKPTICTGPLLVSDVTKKSCSLSWKPPSDNGGKQIIQYEVEKMDESAETWLPAGNPKGTSWELKNLVEGRNYKFLVRAVNDDGDSPNLETENFTTAKNEFDVPTQPGKPKVSNWGPDWAEVTWKASEVDEGAEVKEYKVEMRDVDKRAWNEIAKCKETTFTAEKCGIELDHEYVFRVTAYNVGGESETSETSSEIKAMERFVKPRLDKDLLGKEKDMCASQLLRFEAVAVAEPPAKFSWFLPNGEPLLHNDDRIVIDNSEKNRSILAFKNVERSHSGNFKCLCKNTQGEDEHEIRVTVLAPPLKPTGPIEVSKVNPTGCHLMWTKPKDDGGSTISGYSIEKKDVEKDYWNPCGKIAGKMVTVMREIEYDITDLVENFVYVFRVSAFNAIGEGEPLMTPCPTIAKHELDPPNQPYNINIVDFDKKWVKLDWTIATGPKATKYVVEKTETFLIPKDEEETEEFVGEDGEEAPKMIAGVPMNFTPRDPSKVLHQEYQEYSTGWMVAGTTEDDMPEIKIADLQEGYRYQFRVKGINRAGPSLPSESTDEIVAKQRKQKPIIDRSGMPKEISVARGEDLHLKVKVQGEPITDKAWFWGRREIKSSGTVVIDSSDYASKCSVLNLERADTGTFSFKAENDHGSAEVSIEVNVMIPPQKPKGPMRIDSVHAEGCEACWNQPEDDGGSPVLYYLVEKVQGIGEHWMPCGRSTAPLTEVKVGGLTQDKDYRLRVIAVNAMGASEPLVCVDSFITENPFQCPGAPGRPELKDWDSDHFDMKWTAPRNDGGSRIMGYDLEARLAKDPVWFKAGEVKMQIEHGLVEGIELGSGYTIRARAKNAAGFGPWSIESEQVVCKFKALKPKVKINGPKEITLNEGETVTIFADVPSEPAAEDIKWFISDTELVDDSKNGVVIDNTKEHKSKLQLDAVTRKQGGILTCEASNMHGKAKMSIQLNVHGKPSAPEDRLLVSKISSSGCKLIWTASKNSGGLPLEYLVEKYIVASDSWVKQATTSNTELLVNDLEEGKEYEFRVFAENEIGESEPLTTAKAIVAKNQYSVSLPPSQPDVTEWNERCMTIRWKAPIDDGGMPVYAYTVEARTTGGEWQIWECLDTPVTKATMQKLQKGQEYQFRVIAINKAGKSEPSFPSRPKLAKETDLVPYIDAKCLRDVIVEAKDRVKFDVPIFGEPTPEVCWMKGDETIEELGDKSISIMNTESHTKIVFNNVARKHIGTYSLVLRNKSGEDSAKVSITVLDRPAAPEGPMKTSIEGNAITLLWKKVKDDGGAPIEHYQLEKIDNEKNSWGACGHTKENTLTIPSLPGLTYQFRVTAVNRIGDSDPLISENINASEAADALVRSL